MQQYDRFLALGYRSAAAGYFFDAMELVAWLSVDIGGIDALQPIIRDLEIARHEADEFLKSATPGHDPSVRTVDEYRTFLQMHAFAAVEALAQRTELEGTMRLQAAFYAGFGFGRFRSTLLGVRLFQRLTELAPDANALKAVPARLNSLADEAVRQFAIARREPGLHPAHPRMDGLLTMAPRITANAEDLLAITENDLDHCVQAIDETIPTLLFELSRLDRPPSGQ